MFGFQSFQANPERVLGYLKDFELFCMGEKKLSSEEFMTLNVELSVGAVLHIGKRRYQLQQDGKHLIWTSPDNRDHDLGPIDSDNILREYPGFHRTRSLSLGHDQVQTNETLNIPRLQQQVTVVKLKDGSEGVAPNYKLALRNAVLKMHLKQIFNKWNRKDVWEKFYAKD
jgi:hypothetical protein